MQAVHLSHFLKSKCLKYFNGSVESVHKMTAAAAMVTCKDWHEMQICVVRSSTHLMQQHLQHQHVAAAAVQWQQHHHQQQINGTCDALPSELLDALSPERGLISIPLLGRGGVKDHRAPSPCPDRRHLMVLTNAYIYLESTYKARDDVDAIEATAMVAAAVPLPAVRACR